MERMPAPSLRYRPSFGSQLAPHTALDWYALFVAALLPLHTLQPLVRGVSMFNILNILVVGLILLTPRVRGWRFRFVFIVPLSIYMFGTVLGMFASEVIFRNIYTITQDIYLYIWFSMVLSLVFVHPEFEKKLVLAWPIVGILVFIVSMAFGLGNQHGRIEFTFTNPNRASSYWLVSMFMLFHPDVPRWLRILAWPIFFTAVVLTGSNAGVLAVAIGFGVFFVIRNYLRGGGRIGAGFVLLVTFGLVGAIWLTGTYGIKDALEVVGEAASQGGVEENRIDRSSDVRLQIWTIGMATFREHPMGIGPGSFFAQVETGMLAGRGIELHSDFVATLVERGVIGLIGLVAFIGALLVMVMRSLKMAVRLGDPAQQTWAGAMVSLMPAYISISITHEVLHEDTFWLVLGLAAAHNAVLTHRLRRTEATPRHVRAAFRVPGRPLSGVPQR